MILMRSFKGTSYPHICHKPAIVLFKNRAKISSCTDSKHSVKIKIEKYLEYITNLRVILSLTGRLPFFSVVVPVGKGDSFMKHRLPTKRKVGKSRNLRSKKTINRQ